MENTPQSRVSSIQHLGGSLTPMISLQGQSITTKLDDSNYLLWKLHVMAIVEGFGMESFMEGSDPQPDKFVPGKSEDEAVINPKYVNWRRHDQLIISWLLSPMTDNILIGTVGLTTSKEIWEMVEANYASQSKAKLMQLKYQLQTMKKGASTMKDYLNKIKICCDILGAAGEKVFDENLVLHILAGLGLEYNPVMVSLTSRVESCNLREVKALLLSYEHRLETVEQTTFSIDGSSPTMNMVMQTAQGQGFSHNGGRGNFNNNRGRKNGHANYHGRRGRSNGNWRPRCQICHVIGHTTNRCYERNNPNFNSQRNVAPFNNQRSFPTQTHSNGNPYNGNFNGSPSANVANTASNSMDGYLESSWYPDYGASNHVMILQISTALGTTKEESGFT